MGYVNIIGNMNLGNVYTCPIYSMPNIFYSDSLFSGGWNSYSASFPPLNFGISYTQPVLNFTLPQLVLPQITIPKLKLPEITFKPKNIFAGNGVIRDFSNQRATKNIKSSSYTPIFGSMVRRIPTVQRSSKYSNASSLKNIQWWKNLGYNPQKGRELMNYMRGHVTDFGGNCVGVVREAINRVYYGGSRHYARFGKACNVGRDFLSSDRHFRKVTGVNLASINPKDIPEGVIIIYGPGYSRKHPTCGHGEISNGNGRGYSDGITHIKNSGSQVIKELWIPV